MNSLSPGDGTCWGGSLASHSVLWGSSLTLRGLQKRENIMIICGEDRLKPRVWWKKLYFRAQVGLGPSAFSYILLLKAMHAGSSQSLFRETGWISRIGLNFSIAICRWKIWRPVWKVWPSGYFWIHCCDAMARCWVLRPLAAWCHRQPFCPGAHSLASHLPKKKNWESISISLRTVGVLVGVTSCPKCLGLRVPPTPSSPIFSRGYEAREDHHVPMISRYSLEQVFCFCSDELQSKSRSAKGWQQQPSLF